MEILGDDEAGLPTPPRRGLFGRDDDGRRPDADPVETLTIDDPTHRNGSGPAAPGSDPDRDGPDAGAPAPGRSALLLDTLFGAESLGLAGLLVTVGGVLTTSISPFVLLLKTEALVVMTDDPSQSVREIYSPVVAGFALVGLMLGVAAVLRIRVTSAAWVRGVAGATVLLAMLVLLTTGWAVWNAETGTTTSTSIVP